MIVNGKERDYIIHDENNIKGLFGEYRYLSNFEVCDVMVDGDLYGSSEAAYMAQKSMNRVTRKLFQKSSGITPLEARNLGQTIEVRHNWDKVKIIAMNNALQSKFHLNAELRKKLASTGDKYIEETNHWNDTFWGVCDGVGENHLGHILMMIRSLTKLDKK